MDYIPDLGKEDKTGIVYRRHTCNMNLVGVIVCIYQKRGAEHRMQGREMLLTLMVGWRASVVRAEEAGCFCKVAGMSNVAVCIEK